MGHFARKKGGQKWGQDWGKFEKHWDFWLIFGIYRNIEGASKDIF